MHSLLIGLAAALLWGLHDFTARRIGGRADAAVMLIFVLGFGAVLLAPLAVIAGGWHGLSPRVLGLALASGVGAALAGYGLYRAFAIGPVRLVAPICGAYPMLSVAFAVARGQEAGGLVWLGVLAVVGGIALVARGEPGEADGNPLHAVLWAGFACVNFAATFGLAQWAAEGAADLPVSLVARLGGLTLALAWVALRRPPLAPTLAQWPALLLMGALDVGALTLITVAGGFPRAEYASVASSTFGIVTILLAWRFLGEAMKPLQWLGVSVVFGGIALLGGL